MLRIFPLYLSAILLLCSDSIPLLVELVMSRETKYKRKSSTGCEWESNPGPSGSATISVDVLDRYTIAPKRYLVPLVVHVIVTGTVFAHLGCG